MLKKTTIYIEDSDLELLKRLSFLQNTSTTDLIRLGIREVLSKSISAQDKKALDALEEITKDVRKSGISNKEIMEEAVKAQREVRRERQKNRRR